MHFCCLTRRLTLQGAAHFWPSFSEKKKKRILHHVYFPSCTISIKWINKNIQGLENSVGLCQVWIFAQSLRLGEEVEQKPLFWLKKSRKMQIWNPCVCRRQSDEPRSEVFPLKPKLWQVSVHPWHGLLLIYCASVLCVGWKASSFLWLAASFLSHIFFFFFSFFFCPLFTCTTPQRGFWPECTEK